MLSSTITCDECKGMGKKKTGVQDSNGKDEELLCQGCQGSGVVVDNVVGDLIRKNYPSADRSLLPTVMTAIFKHYEKKLKDSYDRGLRDGKEADKLAKVR